MADFDTMLQGGFGVVTVMNAKLWRYNNRYAGSRGSGDSVAIPTEFSETGIVLDTLKIANLTMEGPTKTITGGQYANPLIKYGKTMTIEMQDALGTKDALVEFMGCKWVNGRLSVTDKFPGAFAIEGETFFIDQQTGDKVPVYIFIPQLLPDAIFNLTQDAEGDATVFDLNGSVCLTKIADNASDAAYTTDPDKVREVFYEIRNTSFFSTVKSIRFDYNWDGDGAPEDTLKTYDGTNAIKVPTPAQNGYTFSGWYDNPEGNGTVVIAAGTATYTPTVNGTTTLYAKWTAQAGA